MLSIDDDCVDEVSMLDEVALSLVEDWNDDTSVVDDDASDVTDPVEVKSDDDELRDTPALDVVSDEVATAESELMLVETSEDDWVVALGEPEADSEVLLTSALDVRSLAVAVSLADGVRSDESLVAEAETLAGALLLEETVPLAMFCLTFAAGR